MDQEEIKELNKIIEDHCQKKGFNPIQVTSFFTVSFVKHMFIRGYSEDYFDITCDFMKQIFRKLKEDL